MKVPFQARPSDIIDRLRIEYPSVVRYIEYIEDAAKVDAERVKQAQCLHGFVHNGYCAYCGKETKE